VTATTGHDGGGAHFPYMNMARTRKEIQDVETVQLNVVAEDEDGQLFHWSTRMPLHQQLMPLRAQWASAHGLEVAAAAVGFEDFGGKEVDLQRTPAELGWICGTVVHLSAVPVVARYAAGSATDPVPSTEVSSTKAPSTEARSTEVASTTQPPKRARTKPPKVAAVRAAISDEAAKETCSSTPPRSSEPATPVLTRSGNSGASNDDEPIVFQSDNPKRAGSAPHERYEKYKVAKTRREALQLGASRSDISYDFKKGFLKPA